MTAERVAPTIWLVKLPALANVRAATKEEAISLMASYVEKVGLDAYLEASDTTAVEAWESEVDEPDLPTQDRERRACGFCHGTGRTR